MSRLCRQLMAKKRAIEVDWMMLNDDKTTTLKKDLELLTDLLIAIFVGRMFSGSWGE